MQTDLVLRRGDSVRGWVRAVAVSSCSSRMTLFVQLDEELVALDYTEVLIGGAQ